MCSMHTYISIILFIRFTTSDFLNFQLISTQTLLTLYLYQIYQLLTKEFSVQSLSFIAQLVVEVLLAAPQNFYGFTIKLKIIQSVFVSSRELIYYCLKWKIEVSLHLINFGLKVMFED